MVSRIKLPGDDAGACTELLFKSVITRSSNSTHWLCVFSKPVILPKNLPAKQEFTNTLLIKNCQLCPETTKLIEQVPNLVTAGFSSLKVGTHITPHTGYPDGVLRCHLGLIGCDGCALRVGEETRSWLAGKTLVFDDTTEHEAWNRGTQTRIVLLLDFKYPVDKKDSDDLTDKSIWELFKGTLPFFN